MWRLLGLTALCACTCGASSAQRCAPALSRLRGGNIDSPYGYRRTSSIVRSRAVTPARKASLLPAELQPEQLNDAERVYVLQQFGRPEIRRKFIARVFSLVSAQIALCVFLIAAVRQLLSANPSVGAALFRASPVFFLLSLIPSLLLNLSRSLAVTPPFNYLLLFAFTLFTGLGLGGFTAILPIALLLRAGLATLVATGTLTTYALTTRRDFTAKRGLLYTGLSSLLVLGLLQFFIGGAWLEMAKVYLGVVVFSGYLIYDTQQIAGGGKQVQLRPTEHVRGALMIFMDIYNLFIYLLQAFMMEERDRR